MNTQMMKQILKPKFKIPAVKIINTVNKIRTGFSLINRKLVPPPVAIVEMISGLWIARAIGLAAELGIADHISDEGTASEVIAKKVHAKPDSIYRLLRALSVVGIFQELPDHKFRLTDLGRCLQTDHPQSMRDFATFQTHTNWQHWEHLGHAVKTGESAVKKVRKQDFFEFLRDNPKIAQSFDGAMVNISKLELDSVVEAYDFSKFNVIADIGGGYGTFLATILKTAPTVKGILFDLPHVAEAADANLKKLKVTERVKVQTGSFFESAPEGADCYMMKHIIHDWSDEKSLEILSHIRKKIPKNGKLLLFETIVPEANVADFSKFIDLEMLVVTDGGKERTREEFIELLAKAKFKVENIIPTMSMVKVIEARPL